MMKTTMLRFIAIVVTSVLLSACGPTLKQGMPLEEIPTPELTEGKFMFKTVPSVSISGFFDARHSQIIAKSYEQEIETESDVASTVESAVIRTFKKLGFNISPEAPVIVKGEVRRWTTDITSGFPATLTAEASIYLEVIDPSNQRIYSGLYSGNANIQRVAVEDKDIRTALNLAMLEALTQITADKKLLNTISSF